MEGGPCVKDGHKSHALVGGGDTIDAVHLQVDQPPVLHFALLNDIILIQYLCQRCTLHKQKKASLIKTAG